MAFRVKVEVSFDVEHFHGTGSAFGDGSGESWPWTKQCLVFIKSFPLIEYMLLSVVIRLRVYILVLRYCKSHSSPIPYAQTSASSPTYTVVAQI